MNENIVPLHSGSEILSATQFLFLFGKFQTAGGWRGFEKRLKRFGIWKMHFCSYLHFVHTLLSTVHISHDTPFSNRYFTQKYFAILFWPKSIFNFAFLHHCCLKKLENKDCINCWYQDSCALTMMVQFPKIYFQYKIEGAQGNVLPYIKKSSGVVSDDAIFSRQSDRLRNFTFQIFHLPCKF